MTVLERMAETWGRTIGSYYKGLDTAFSTSGARPQLSDESAYIDPLYWGAAFLEGKKPRTKAEFVKYYQGWVYISSRKNGQGVAQTPLKLYVAKPEKGQKFQTIQTREISKATLKYLESKPNLQGYLSRAIEIEEVVEHQILTLFKEVNPYNNSFDMWETTVMFLDLTGECYWYMPSVSIEEAKLPRQIWTIPSQFINPVFGTSLDKAIIGYKYERGAVDVTIPVDDIIMFTYPNPNNIFTGFSCIRGVADAVYINAQMNAFEESLFENRARPGGIITPKGNISKEARERLKQEFEQKFKGSKKAGRTLLLPKDTDYTRDTMTPQELSFIDGRKVNRTEIMASLDVPEGVIISESSNRAVAEAANYQHAKYGISPRCKRIEEKLNEQLVSKYDEKLFLSFDNPVPEDRELLLKEQTERVKSNIILINEARAEIGLEPIEGGDIMWMDNRLIAMGTTPPTTEEQAEEFARQIRENIRGLLE